MRYIVTKLQRLISIAISIGILLALSCITASALSWDGSSSGGSGGNTSAGNKGYAIRTTGDNCLGYRFSAVNKSGDNKVSKVIDVFRNTDYGTLAYGSGYKYTNKYNKKQLIAHQNSGFSTGNSAVNCYKESIMSFATGLPSPSGMKTWQNNKTNLNSILSKLGISGGIDSFKNGDKVIVEPLYDVRLESVYHALTVTEIALYGKHILGAESTGGVSTSPETWGFISSYTNKVYPNELFTTDGQDLWTAASALSSRETFKNIINMGYGAGIAYTETKSDFTPSLTVKVCEVWKGKKSTRDFKYGQTNGAAFSNYSYKNGYPIQGDTVWYAVNFPAEKENCYVKQTVWIVGGEKTSRNVWSNNKTWYEVSLSPSSVDSERSSYILKARVDWINSDGKTLKTGAVKTFYIPIRPKINRYKVNLTDITNQRVNTGVAYVGQRVYPEYVFTSNNKWTSYNNLTGYISEWKEGKWSSAKTTPDMVANNVGISESDQYRQHSSILPYRITDNSENTSKENKTPFYLTSAWVSDVSRTKETTCINVPVIKADVELKEIRLIDENGYYTSQTSVWENQLVTPQYIYSNNTDCTVYVEGYNSDTTRMSGIYAIPANGQIAVNGKQLRVGKGPSFGVWGGVYLEGAGRSTSWEKDDIVCKDNNHGWKYWTVKKPLTIEAVLPNSDYREGVQVISSFMVNNTSPSAFIPSDKVTVEFYVTKGTTVYSSQNKATVIPGGLNNLVYFKWTVPKNMYGQALIISADVYCNGKFIDTDSYIAKPVVIDNSQTPDTAYESAKPSGWTASALPSETANTASWSIWTYSNGIFTKSNYGVRLSIHGLTIQPDSNSPSAEETKNGWNMKSGYGFTLNWSPSKKTTQGSSIAMSLMTTQVQSGYAMYPEYNYSAAYGKHSTLRLASSVFSLKENTAAEGSSPVHFIPVWYPSGTQNYAVSAYAYDCWTPAGMIGARASSNALNIVGSLYDDYYVGR